MKPLHDRIEAAKAHLRIRGYIAKDDSLTVFTHQNKQDETKFIFRGGHISTSGKYTKEIHELYLALIDIMKQEL